MIRTFLFKLVLLVTLIGIGHLLMTLVMPINVVPEISQLDALLAGNADVIFFGDSTITSVAPSDQNKDFISTMLQNKQPNRLIGRISHPAYNMDLYVEYAHYLANQESPPQTVIIPINLRSFSPEWDMRPGYQFEQEKRFLRHNNNLFIKAVDGPLSIFHWYEPEVINQVYENTAVFDGDQQVGIVKDFEQILSEEPTRENILNILIYNYLYALDSKHRKLQSLIELVDVYRANDIDVIFYITPLDYETGEQYLEERYHEQVDQNIALITSLLADKDVELLDLSFSLTPEFFAWYEYPNEHLNENGRNFVAEQLSQALNHSP